MKTDYPNARGDASRAGAKLMGVSLRFLQSTLYPSLGNGLNAVFIDSLVMVVKSDKLN